MPQRYLHPILMDHLKKLRQMVFLVGPRQVGKTTLAKEFLPQVLEGVNYFNWDLGTHRKILITRIFQGSDPLTRPEQQVLVFDEIHKYPRWKNALKGLFDTHEPKTHWIITGSAALNVYRRGQDSLLGRCFTYHLCPFSLSELVSNGLLRTILPEALLKTVFEPPTPPMEKIFQHLLQFSGFPEPYMQASNPFLGQWRTSRLEKLLNQDMASTENLKNLPLVEQLVYLLPERVGSPLSINSLREDLEVHFNTVKHWLMLLERVFYGFTVFPYTAKLNRLLKKEGKWYLWDWTEITEPGIRFENLVAVHLLKYVYYLNDLGRDSLSLHYLRDKEKREVDFILCRKKKPLLAIECKWKLKDATTSLLHYAKKLGLKHVFLVVGESVEPQSTLKDGVQITTLSAASFLSKLV